MNFLQGKPTVRSSIPSPILSSGHPLWCNALSFSVCRRVLYRSCVSKQMINAGIVRRARAYVAAAGCHSLEINGKRPSLDLRGVCAWTVVQKRVLYQTHDITNLVQAGTTNVVGILSNRLTGIGAAFPSSPFMRAIVRVEFGSECGGGANAAPASSATSSAPAPAPAPFMLYTAGGNKNTSHWMEAASWVSMHGDGREWLTQLNWTAKEQNELPLATRALQAGGGGWLPAKSMPFGAQSPAQQMPVATVLRKTVPSNVKRLSTNATQTAWLYTFSTNFVGTVELQPLPTASEGAKVTLMYVRDEY